jgi:hypothetical protein
MSSWLRHLTLLAEARTGFSVPIGLWLLVTIVSSGAVVVFLCISAFLWIALRYDPLTANLAMACLFLFIASTAGFICVSARQRNMELARLVLASRSRTPWLDPRVLALGLNVGRSIGWGKLIPLAVVAIVAGVLGKKWLER